MNYSKEIVEVAFNNKEAEFVMSEYERMNGADPLKYDLEVVDGLVGITTGKCKYVKIPYQMCIMFMDNFDCRYSWCSGGRMACNCWCRIMFKDLKGKEGFEVYSIIHDKRFRRRGEEANKEVKGFSASEVMEYVHGVEKRYITKEWCGENNW